MSHNKTYPVMTYKGPNHFQQIIISNNELFCDLIVLYAPPFDVNENFISELCIICSWFSKYYQ